MRDSSQPRGDRAELENEAATEPQERRRAILLRLRNGSFFRDFRPRGRGSGAVWVPPAGAGAASRAGEPGLGAGTGQVAAARCGCRAGRGDHRDRWNIGKLIDRKTRQ